MQRNNWKIICGLTAIALGIPGSAMADWPSFAVYPITGIGGYATQALAINAQSEIGGLAQPGFNNQVFNGLFGGAGYTSQISPIPNGWSSVEFSGINDSLYMIGTAMISLHPTAVGAQANGNIVSMTEGIPYSYFSQAMGVNHAGNVVGYYNQEAGGVVTHMFRWSSVSTTRTWDLVGYLPGGINENGAIAASNLNPHNYYDQAELDIFPTTGSPSKYLAPGDFLYIYPSGISTYGGITTIGQTYLQQITNSNTHLEGYAYNVAANQWTALDAPGNPFYSSNALAVDVWGQKIVGTTTNPNGDLVATIWELVNGQWVASYLSDILPADPNWKYTAATGINTYGAISGYGEHLENGRFVQRGFVASPLAYFHVVFPEGGIYGGLTATPSVHVNGLNPFDADFFLTADSSSVSVPRVVDMPGMTADFPFSMPTMGVDKNTTVDVTVRFGGIKYTAPVLLLPAVLIGETLSTYVNSDGGRGSIALRGEAGPSGVTASLMSSNPSVTVPATVAVQPGASSASFRMALGRGAKAGTVVTITAMYSGRTVSQQVTVQ